MLRLYGIPNCDTVRKARRWLEEHQVSFRFIDFQKEAVNLGELAHWQVALGWETLLNRRGLTWRRLPQARQAAVVDAASAARLSAEFPSLIKRPVLVTSRGLQAGFTEAGYRRLCELA